MRVVFILENINNLISKIAGDFQSALPAPHPVPASLTAALMTRPHPPLWPHPHPPRGGSDPPRGGSVLDGAEKNMVNFTMFFQAVEKNMVNFTMFFQKSQLPRKWKTMFFNYP